MISALSLMMQQTHKTKNCLAFAHDEYQMMLDYVYDTNSIKQSIIASVYSMYI